jgi:hypothetical protein
LKYLLARLIEQLLPPAFFSHVACHFGEANDLPVFADIDASVLIVRTVIAVIMKEFTLFSRSSFITSA